MMNRMNLKHRTLRLYGTAMAAAVPFLLPALALAKPAEDESATLEARLEGYGQTTVRLTDPGSTAFTWVVLILLTVIGILVLFKNANRSHLD